MSRSFEIDHWAECNLNGKLESQRRNSIVSWLLSCETILPLFVTFSSPLSYTGALSPGLIKTLPSLDGVIKCLAYKPWESQPVDLFTCTQLEWSVNLVHFTPNKESADLSTRFCLADSGVKWFTSFSTPPPGVFNHCHSFLNWISLLSLSWLVLTPRQKKITTKL